MPTIIHDETLADRAAMIAIRAAMALQPKLRLVPESRPAGDEMLQKTPAFEGMTYTPEEIGGVAGWWCRPTQSSGNAIIMFLHGGAYVLGSATAYRNFAGQLAGRTGLAAFVGDYALAPERPFPAAFDDAMSIYRALAAEGHRIILAGDSAGGGLALAVLAALSTGTEDLPRPVAAVVMSPWIDLGLNGESVERCASNDPLLTREALTEAAALYLGHHSAHDSRVSALDAPVANLPPVQIHVGTDEILLDDSVRYAKSLEEAGGQIDLHIWKGMIHVFPSSVTFLAAARKALDLSSEFIKGLA